MGVAVTQDASASTVLARALPEEKVVKEANMTTLWRGRAVTRGYSECANEQVTAIT